MALALSQGRFDRQMERHIEMLRDDMQHALDAMERRLSEQITRQLGQAAGAEDHSSAHGEQQSTKVELLQAGRRSCDPSQ